jgi:cytoskeletal protein CcmA (bactofilin family)
MSQRYFGKYKGKVLSTEDLTVSGKLLCEVPALPDMLLNWAVPCVPYAGIEQGFFALPEEGADIWVEFEQGNPDYPIWSGGFWEPGEEPVMPELDPEAPELINVLRSKFSALVLDDTPGEGGLRLSTGGEVATVPISVSMNESGFSIRLGELSLTMDPEVGITLTAGPSTLTLTAEGLEITTPKVTVTAEEGMTVTADTELTGDVTIVGATDITGDVEIAGAVEIEGDTEVTGAVEIEGETNVTGAVTIEGETNVAGALTVEGETNIAGELSVEGDANFLGAQQTEGNNAVLGLIEGIVVPPGL